MPIEFNKPLFKVVEFQEPREEKFILSEVINGCEVIHESEIMDIETANYLNRGFWFNGYKKRWKKA